MWQGLMQLSAMQARLCDKARSEAQELQNYLSRAMLLSRRWPAWTWQRDGHTRSRSQIDSCQPVLASTQAPRASAWAKALDAHSRDLQQLLLGLVV